MATYLDQLTERDLAISIWQALRRIESTLTTGLTLPDIPAPIVNVPAVDLADVVNAVTGLNGTGPSAAEIAEALAAVLAPGAPDATDALAEVAKALEKLDFRLQGVGTQAYGGGSVTIQRGQTVGVDNFPTDLAKDATLLRRYGDHVTKAGFANTAGDNTLHTPAAGMRVRLYWIGLSASQDNAAENLVQVKLTDADGLVKYRWRMGNPGAFVGGRTIDGNVDEPLVLNLANTNGIDRNVDMEEVV